MGPEFFSKLTPQERANLIHIWSDPLRFAESLCVIPNGPEKGEPFYANYPQRVIMENRGMVNYLLVSRRAGKCGTEFLTVLDRNTLKPTPLKDIPTNTEVLVFDFELSEVVWSKAVKIAAGKKPCLKIHTDTGTQLSVSTDHPLFEARKGWVTADMLHMGDRILCPGSVPVFGSLGADSNKINELYDKYVEESEFPSEVYLLNKKSLKAFLTKYWEEEGRIFDQFKSVIFMLMSREICLPLKHLLLRFGVESRITPEGNLVIDDPLDLSTFFNLVGIEYPRYEVRSPRRWETITLIKKIGEWECYDFQVEHVDANFIAEDVVIHNSYIMNFFALYHAVTESDKNIVVFAPAKPQIDEFFRNLDDWIRSNPIFNEWIDPSGEQRNNPYPIRSFLTGSRIVGYITGINEGTEESKRGLTADVVIGDEVQSFSEKDWRLVLPIMQGEQRRTKDGTKKGRRGTIRSYLAGTVMEPAGFFYEKTNGVVPLAPNERVFKIPINENQDFTPEDLEEIKLSISHTSWVTEYLLQYGDTRSSVFRQSDIEIASATDWEYGIENTDRSLVRFIGVDWDHGSEKSKAGTNIVVVQYNPYTGDMTTIERVEVPPEEYTFLKACHLVIDYAFVYGPIDGIIVDMGQGIFQGEWLKDQCIQRGMSDLASKVTVLHLGKVIPVQVIGEEEPRRVFAKEFLVGLLQKKFQEKKVVFPSHDTKFREQLISYKKIGETQRGAKYSSGNEHIIDAHLFCMYGIWTYYEEQALTSPKFSPDHAYTEVGVEHTRLPFEMEMNQYNNNWTDARVTRTGEDGRPKDQGFDRGIRDSFRNQGRGSIFD